MTHHHADDPAMRPFARLAAFCALALGGGAGCGTDDAPPIGLVTGTVTRGGQPIPGLTVSFLPDDGRPSWGITDDYGQYTLHWDEDHDGAEVGRHKVCVAFDASLQADESGRDAAAKGKARAKAKPAPMTERRAIVEKYGIASSTLTKEVKAGSQTIDLQLD
jgi:hypothetical protein